MDKEKWFLVIVSLLLPVFLLLCSYTLILWLIPLLPAQQETMDYLLGNDERKEGLHLEYTGTELSHLQDVQRVMQKAQFSFLALLLAFLIIFFYYRNDQKKLLKFLKYGGVATMVSIGVITLFLGLAFNYLFALFHQLFFPQGNWQFPVDSLLIQTFPLAFFVRISIFIFVLAFLLGLSLYLISIFIEHKYSKR